jgi:hypothetical protein
LGEEPLGADGEMGCGKEPQKVAATDLSAMMQALTNHRFDGHPISDVDGYQKHVDSVAHGLFSLFLSAVPNQTAGTKEKVAMILELFGHIVDPAYSQMAWELTTVLHSSGVSDRQLRGLSSKGLVMCTSKLHEHENLMQERHERRLKQLCSDSEKRLMLVTDDFHQIESAHGLPRKKKWKVFGGAPRDQCHSQGTGRKRIRYCGRAVSRMFDPKSVLCRRCRKLDTTALERLLH